MSSINRPYGKTNSWGAMEAGSLINKELIDSEVKRLKNELINISKKYIDIRDKKIVPTKPRNIVAVSSVNDADITWDEPLNTFGIDSYVIYKDGKYLDTIKADINNYLASDLRANTIYGFKVVAKYVNGEISKSVSISVRTKK